MKKIIFALAAVAALASCSKSDVAYEANEEIGFVPMVTNMTKTMMIGDVFQTTEEFNLWAYYKPVDPGTGVDAWLADTSTPQTYIDEKTFKYLPSESKWGGKNNPYFWPKNGSLVFVGYYPAGIKDKVTHDLASNTMSFYDIPQSRVASTGYTEDLMYFNMTPSYATSSVAATFKHALSWISLVLVKDGTTSDRATITVEKVEFTDVLPQGDGVVVGANNISWTAKGAASTVDILDDGDPVTSNNVVLVKNNTTQQPYEPLFIPQTMTGDLIITYTITSEDGSYFREVKTIPLNTMKTDVTSWDPAKHYTYTITIGTTEILVDPKVTPWVDVDVPTTI